MARLRAPEGCPWDREQSFETIKPYLLEEAYEVMDAIDAGDWGALAEELGDLMLQPVFFAQMAQEAGHFDIADALRAISEKLVRRHPHVFSDGDAKTPGEVKTRWDEIKKAEHKEKGKERKSLLEGIPRALPALAEATQISTKVADKGFEWDSMEQVLAKVDEEIAELKHEIRAGEREKMQDEFGDLLFVLVNVARWLKVDPEQALRRSNAKFRRRFAQVEAGLAERGKTVEESDIAEMEELWQKAKQAE
jgi:MazG family protein